MDNLKPCPFCGRIPKIAKSDMRLNNNNGDISIYWSVRCTTCGAYMGPYISYYEITSDETLELAKPHEDGLGRAIAEWNRRASDV